MIDDVKKEICIRLGVIIKAAQIMQSDIMAHNFAHLEKPMQEIEQYTRSVRLDADYLKASLSGFVDPIKL